MNVRLILIAMLAAAAPFFVAQAGRACTMNEIQKPETRIGLCRQQPGIATGFGCTSLLMKEQAADQFQQIELARRCGFNAEASVLENYYKQTTPLVVGLYECIDTAVDRADVEKQAHAEVAKRLSTMSAGCTAELKEKMAKRLPKLIEIDKKSYVDMKVLAEGIGLEKPPN